MFKKSFMLFSMSLFSVFASDNNSTILHSNQVEVMQHGKAMVISRNMDIRCRKVPFDGKHYGVMIILKRVCQRIVKKHL